MANHGPWLGPRIVGGSVVGHLIKVNCTSGPQLDQCSMGQTSDRGPVSPAKEDRQCIPSIVAKGELDRVHRSNSVTSPKPVEHSSFSIIICDEFKQ
uniref:Uncharacterized protein n=1 Tax=Solanum tuberosum TaxID=4113 RepID=M1DFE8_SOLTU